MCLVDLQDFVLIETKYSLNRFFKDKIIFGFKEKYYNYFFCDDTFWRANILELKVYKDAFSSSATSLAEPFHGFSGYLDFLFKNDKTVGSVKSIIYTRQRYQYIATRGTADNPFIVT